MIAGVLTIITAVIINNSFGATLISLGYLYFATILIAIYAHKVYKIEITEGR